MHDRRTFLGLAATAMLALKLDAQTPAPAQAGPPPDWYDDPWRQARLRYWDGTAWTGHTAP